MITWERFVKALKGVVAVGIVLFIATVADAGNVTLVWDAPTTNSDGTPITFFAGAYKIYYGTTSGTYTQTISVVDTKSQVTYTVPNLTDGTKYYFVATAINTIGNESEYSNEVNKTVGPKPGKPLIMRIQP